MMAGDRFNAFLDRKEPDVSNASHGPLAGLTLAVKDIFDIEGQRTGGGNPAKLAEAKPAQKTASAIRMLLDSGARFVGRTQTDELTFSLMGQNAHFPHPINPAAPDRVTGGSSSGSAAAVAGGLADIAAGSDTGGSIRAPAAFCGLIGLRTTHGAIPLAGAMPLAPSLDTFGWFARDIETYEKVGAVFFGDTGGPLTRPLRLAALDDLLAGEAERTEYARMANTVADTLGTPADAPALSQSLDDLYMIFRQLQAYEAWAIHGPWISAADRNLGPGVRERFEFGSTLGCDVATAQTAKRTAFREELAGLLGHDGVLVMPTVPGAAPLSKSSFDDVQAYRERALRLLCLSGLSGFPQITIPLGHVDGAPFGISLLGPAGSDRALIGLARQVLAAAH
jgi:amidase